MALTEADDETSLLVLLSKRKPKESEGLIAFKSGDKGDSKMLSNFYPMTILYKGLPYPSAEHLYQWLKLDTIPNVDARLWQQRKVLQSPHASDAKKYGSKWQTHPEYRDHVKKYVDENHKKIMKKVLFAKFYPKGPVRDYLLSTGDAVLYERAGGRDKKSPWVGPNGLLGKLLTDLRGYLADPCNVVTEENWEYYKSYEDTPVNN